MPSPCCPTHQPAALSLEEFVHTVDKRCLVKGDASPTVVGIVPLITDEHTRHKHIKSGEASSQLVWERVL